MSFGDEDMMFEAEDILSFSYEALPHIDGRRSRSGMLTKIRTAFTAPDRPASSSIDLRDDRHLEVIATHPTTEAAAEVPADKAEHCIGTRRDGLPCRSSIVLNSGFCSAHDPNRPKARVRTVPVEDPSLASVFRHLERAVSDVRAGRMDPDTAIALAELARAMCATIDADEITQGHQMSEPAYLRRAK